ncbi:MAG: heme o synthase [Pseudomonadota bacterium]
MSDASLHSNVYANEPQLSDYFALLKPRVMTLVVFTAFIGLVAAPGSLHPVEAFAAILFIAIGGGASGALNMWWDSDIDAVMKRTAKRPIPAGKVEPQEALYLGLFLSVMSVTMLTLATNWVAGGMLAFTIFFYAVIYSMWLKRSTPQNIVIGGAAGAFPPVIGWAAVTGAMPLEAWAMFTLIFMWTPPHFWALALFMKSDYDDAGVPMLTVTHGRKSTRNHILVYTVLLAILAVGAAFTGIGGPIYLVVALVLNGLFLAGAVRIWARAEETAIGDDYTTEKKFFRLSLWYLFLHFGAIGVEAFIGGWATWL